MVWIAQAARQTGASVKAIRLYESLGLIQPARHVGYRYFDPTTLEILCCIKTAQSLGFSLKQLQELQHNGQWDAAGFEAAIAQRKQDLQVQIDVFQDRMRKLDKLAQDVKSPYFCHVPSQTIKTRG